MDDTYDIRKQKVLEKSNENNKKIEAINDKFFRIPKKNPSVSARTTPLK